MENKTSTKTVKQFIQVKTMTTIMLITRNVFLQVCFGF
jgi:hypothetical protein